MRTRARIVAAIYFLIATFTIVGDPFAANGNHTIPVFGILLTMPWSLMAGLLKYSSAAAGTVALEVCALINALILYRVVS